MFTKEELVSRLRELENAFKNKTAYVYAPDELSSPYIRFSMTGYKYYSTWGAPADMGQRMIDWIVQKRPEITEHWRMGHLDWASDESTMICRGDKAHFPNALEFWMQASSYNSIIRQEGFGGWIDDLLYEPLSESSLQEIEPYLVAAMSHHFFDGIKGPLLGCLKLYDKGCRDVRLYETQDEYIAYAWRPLV